MDNVDKYVDYLLKDEKSNTSKIVDKGIKGGKTCGINLPGQWKQGRLIPMEL